MAGNTVVSTIYYQAAGCCQMLTIDFLILKQTPKHYLIMSEDFCTVNILTWDYSKLLIFKDCGGYVLLPYLQAKRLACHSFMDAGKRAKISGAEAKDSWLLTAVAVLRIPEFVPHSTAHVQQGEIKWSKYHLHVCCRRKALNVGYLHLS